MKIVVDIGHPAQVHLFRHLINALKSRGDQVLITTADKDVTLNLLDEYGFSYVNVGSTGKNPLQKILNIPKLDWRFYQAVKDFDFDLVIGCASIRAAHIAKLRKKPALMFVDTEMSALEHSLYAPFVSYIATPQCLRRDFGQKHIRYNGYHELAYLHPNRFKPDAAVLDQLKLKEGDDFIILRFVAWQATHDLGKKGFTFEQKRQLIDLLKDKGRIFITAEENLEDDFRPFAFPGFRTQLLDALYYAKMVITESQTVATEAALLGTPAIRFNSYAGQNDMGNFIELGQEYSMVHSFNDFSAAKAKIQELLAVKGLKAQLAQKRDRLMNEKIDLTEWMIQFIDEKWPHFSQNFTPIEG